MLSFYKGFSAFRLVREGWYFLPVYIAFVDRNFTTHRWPDPLEMGRYFSCCLFSFCGAEYHHLQNLFELHCKYLNHLRSSQWRLKTSCCLLCFCGLYVHHLQNPFGLHCKYPTFFQKVRAKKSRCGRCRSDQRYHHDTTTEESCLLVTGQLAMLRSYTGILRRQFCD